MTREELIEKYLSMREKYQEIQSDLRTVKLLLEKAISVIKDVSRTIGPNTEWGYKNVKRLRPDIPDRH